MDLRGWLVLLQAHGPRTARPTRLVGWSLLYNRACVRRGMGRQIHVERAEPCVLCGEIEDTRSSFGGLC